MKLSFFYTVDTRILTLALFVVMVAAIKLGQAIAKKTGRETGDNPGNSVITGSLYGLLGLLLAFTFGMSGDRFKERRNIIAQEANHIGTAIFRIQLYADSVQPLFRENFGPYLEARIKYFSAHRDTAQIKNRAGRIRSLC